MIKLGKLLKEALDVSWNPFVENQNTWENYTKLCTERVASHINLDDTYNVVKLGGWGEEIKLGEMTAREALDRYIEMCQETFNDDIEKMFEYWEDFTSTDRSVEALADDAIHVQDPELRTLEVTDEDALELKPLKNNSNDLDEALDISWNPYEDNDNFWWYVDEGYGIDQDGIMDIIKAAANKVVGETAPNRNSYFNVWYDILDQRVTDASQNVEDYDDDDEIYGTVRGEIEYYTDPENWDDAKDMIVYNMESMSNIVADKKTLANFQKMGVLIHKMLIAKHKPSLSEALDVSWNPFETWKDKYTENSWLKVTIGSRGELEDAEIEEIPNIKDYLLDRKKSDYKRLLKDLKQSDYDEDDRENEIRYFNEFCGPYKMDTENSDQWGYGIGEEDHEMYYRLLSNKYSEWVANMVATYGNDFVDHIGGGDVDELDNL